MSYREHNTIDDRISNYAISHNILNIHESSIITEEERQCVEQYKMIAKQIEYESESINIYCYKEPIKQKIQEYYHQLYLLEYSKPLQDVLERENEKKLALEMETIEKERKKSHKFFEKFGNILGVIALIIILAIPVCGMIFGFYQMFSTIWGILSDFILFLGNGSWIRGLILLPFCSVGLIQIIRGLIETLRKDEEKWWNGKNGMLICIYFVFTICCCITLFAVLVNHK